MQFRSSPLRVAAERYKQASPNETKIRIMKDEEIECFNIYLNQLKIIKNDLESLYGNNNNLFNKKIGTFHLFRSIFSNLNFLHNTYEESPFSSFATLARMIIDNYSILYLMTSYSSEDEQTLRYYLFFIDSLEGRIKTTTDFSEAVNYIPDEILKSNQNLMNHDRNSADNFKNRIITEKLDLLVNKSIIESNNWKYASEKKANNKKYYNWQELYQIAKIPNHFSKAIQNHFSAFTHGLALSILYTEEKSISKQSIIAIINLIQNMIGKIMLTNFSEELKNSNISESFVKLCDYHWENWK